ncbi:hypothetical protein F5Y10DRAFT_209929 [Nemania abortiva]|nr:hypothetical protein F5Y10DRAFT_209929 [Nemania abortiva]
MYNHAAMYIPCRYYTAFPSSQQWNTYILTCRNTVAFMYVPTTVLSSSYTVSIAPANQQSKNSTCSDLLYYLIAQCSSRTLLTCVCVMTFATVVMKTLLRYRNCRHHRLTSEIHDDEHQVEAGEGVSKRRRESLETAISCICRYRSPKAYAVQGSLTNTKDGVYTTQCTRVYTWIEVYTATRSSIHHSTVQVLPIYYYYKSTK